MISQFVVPENIPTDMYHLSGSLVSYKFPFKKSLLKAPNSSNYRMRLPYHGDGGSNDALKFQEVPISVEISNHIFNYQVDEGGIQDDQNAN